jgi:hypothetical protein
MGKLPVCNTDFSPCSTLGAVGAIVQVRLDEEMREKLDRAARRLGLSRSEALREGIRLVDQTAGASSAPRLAGIGCVDFGPGDLATNKKYLKSLGARSMGKGWSAENPREQ